MSPNPNPICYLSLLTNNNVPDPLLSLLRNDNTPRTQTQTTICHFLPATVDLNRNPNYHPLLLPATVAQKLQSVFSYQQQRPPNCRPSFLTNYSGLKPKPKLQSVNSYQPHWPQTLTTIRQFLPTTLASNPNPNYNPFFLTNNSGPKPNPKFQSISSYQKSWP